LPNILTHKLSIIIYVCHYIWPFVQKLCIFQRCQSKKTTNNNLWICWWYTSKSSLFAVLTDKKMIKNCDYWCSNIIIAILLRKDLSEYTSKSCFQCRSGVIADILFYRTSISFDVNVIFPSDFTVDTNMTIWPNKRVLESQPLKIRLAVFNWHIPTILSNWAWVLPCIWCSYVRFLSFEG